MISSGMATTTSILTAGAHSISAVYSGDASFNSSTSQVFTQIINNPADKSTTATATATPNPVLFRKTMTFAVAVTASDGTPGGNVVFMDGPTTLGSGMLNESGQATINISQLTLGRHQIVAMYTGGGGFQGSISSPVIVYRSPRPR